MEIPTPIRPVLKWRVTRTAITIILAQIIGLTVFLRGCTKAPGAQPPPHPSQIGKVDLQHRGGSFSDPDFFEHYVYFPIRDDNKLFPKLRPTDICADLAGKTE